MAVRMQALERYEMDMGRKMPLEGVMDPFIRSAFKSAIEGGDSWHNYLAVVAQVNGTSGWGAALIAKFGDPSIQ